MKFLYLSFFATLFINLVCIIVINWSGYWALRPVSPSGHFYDSFMRTHPNRDLKESQASRECIKEKAIADNKIIHIDTNDSDAVLWLSRGGIYLFPNNKIQITETISQTDGFFNLSKELRECNQ